MTEPSTESAKSAPGTLWPAAAAIAAFGTWMFFDALPGVNWILWTGAAATCLVLFTRPRGDARRSVVIMGTTATVIAGVAAVTSSPWLWALSCLGVMFFLSLQMLVAATPSLRSVTIWFAMTAPLFAFRDAALQALRSSIDATHLIHSTRARARVRGLVITLPVVAVFALLLAGADPIFAAWRDTVASLFADWEFLPRTVFFGALLVISLGAYGYASLAPEGAAADAVPHAKWLGSTERLMLLGSVAALFWLFLAVQLGYLFGNLPSVPASGVTFAEYARRGFGELTVVASASALLIVGTERYGNDERVHTLRLLTFAVIGAVVLLLASAFRRVWLYEMAYGFTTARLYAQAYMCVVAAALAALSLEVAGEFDVNRLFRRAGAAATILFIALAYWNHEAWIARQNIDRFASTGKLDVSYLTEALSPDAVPAITERLTSLPDPLRSQVSDSLRQRYSRRGERRVRRWFEWNLASQRARQALGTSGVLP